jgi:uncharacterized protein YfaP (DUF2135 family)
MRRLAVGRGVLTLAWVVALAAPLAAEAQDEDETLPGDPRDWDGPLHVHIDQPSAGVEDADHTVQLVATVSDPRLTLATLTVNGASYEVPVAGGTIDQTVIVAPGVNRVGVRVAREGDHASDSITWTVRGERTELMVIATWHADGEIIDLWTREPEGEICKWDHRTTEAGGRLLDMSADAIGFGSQAFVAPEVRAGTYRIKVHFWSDRSGETSQRYTYDDLLAQLDAAETALGAATPATLAATLAERDRLAAELDRWATPDAPQVPVHVEAILFPGTEHERRFRFDRLVRRTGQLATLGEIEIDEETIRAARAETETDR